jgi:hypothetical protein
MTTLHPVPAYLPAHASAFSGMHSGHTPLLLGVAALFVLAVGVAAGAGLSTVLRRNPLPQNAPLASNPSHPPGAPSQHANALAGQRAALITGMLTIRGLIDDPQVADVVDDSLRTAGVTVFDPTGHTKDPRYHRVDHTEPAAHPGQVDTIARTLTPGYIDDGRVLQPADVVVYQ